MSTSTPTHAGLRSIRVTGGRAGSGSWVYRSVPIADQVGCYFWKSSASSVRATFGRVGRGHRLAVAESPRRCSCTRLAVSSSPSLLRVSSRARSAQQHHQHQHTAPEKLGTVTFPTSCAPAVQARLRARRGPAPLVLVRRGGEGLPRGRRRRPVVRDGAVGRGHEPVPPDLGARPRRQSSPAGAPRSRRRARLGAKTERETAYIAAIEAFFQDSETEGPRARARSAYQKAMEAVYTGASRTTTRPRSSTRWPCSDPTPARDKTYANQYKAGEILNRVLPRQPTHPGVAHYLIHSFDYPKVAELALPAARSYSKIAESSPHALHMPSHIFVRLGLWDDSIRVQQRLRGGRPRARAARRCPARSSFDELHALDYLAYAYPAAGPRRQGAASARPDPGRDEAGPARSSPPPTPWPRCRRGTPWSVGRWADAAALRGRAGLVPVEPLRLRGGDHALRSCRGRRAERRRPAGEGGGGPAATRSIRRLVDAKTPYWPDQVEIQRRAAAAWIARPRSATTRRSR